MSWGAPQPTGQGWDVPTQRWTTKPPGRGALNPVGNRQGNGNHELELDLINTNMKMLSASIEDLRKVISLLDQKIDILWNAPGMPGSQEAKAAFEADMSKGDTH